MSTFGLLKISLKRKVYCGYESFRDEIILDADPHVMSVARKLFDHGTSHLSSGKHTHKILTIPLNNSNAKDLIWFSSRFPLEIEPKDMATLYGMSEAYDKVVAAVSVADQDPTERYSPTAMVPIVPLRPHQTMWVNMANMVGRTLLADVMGMGKTISALGTLAEADSRPAIVVCPPHLCSQWNREIKRVYPDFTTHVIPGFKNYDLPDVDVLITSYNRLQPWQDTLGKTPWATTIFDECHDLRKTDTGKREMARVVSKNSRRVYGLSGTPIFNYGIELWSVMDVLHPEILGLERDFEAEWCVNRRVREPAVLNTFLKTQGLMLRRTPEEVGLDFGNASKFFYTIDADLKSLEALESVMKTLALSLLSMKIGKDGDSAEAAREFDYKLRKATGVAKAKSVAQFVRMMVEQGEKVVLAGWHRDVYDIWLKELADCNPVMFTGTEGPNVKAKAAQKFIEDETCMVFIISLRSGAGLDGLQHVCRNVVFGELDWSPHVMDQLVMRVDRDGKKRQAQAFYLAVNDGSDPFIMNILNAKRAQHDGLIEGKQAEGEVIAGSEIDPLRIQEMAKAYLLSIGEEIPVPVEEVGVMGEVARAMRTFKVPANSEEEIQEAVSRMLPPLIPGLTVEREARVGKRSRLDFLVTDGTERVAIEIKKDQTDRVAVYRQVRKYVKEANINSLILFAPWFGIPSFTVDGIPVIVVDYTKNSI